MLSDEQITRVLFECGFIELDAREYHHLQLLGICDRHKLIPRWNNTRDTWHLVQPSIAGPSLATLLITWPLIPAANRLECVRKWMQMLRDNGVAKRQASLALITCESLAPQFVAEIVELLGKEQIRAN